MIETDISIALLKAVADAVAGSDTPDIPVSYPMRSFDPPLNGSPWIEVVQIRNNILGETWGDTRTYQGMLRLLLHYPRTDVGVRAANTILDNIAAQPSLSKGVRHYCGEAIVMFYSEPDLGSIVEDKERGDTFFPLTFRYRNFQP